MSDLEVAPGSASISFPDGTSKVFKGSTREEISRQAKAYWDTKHPAPKVDQGKATATAAAKAMKAVPVPPAIPRAAIDAYRLQHFNSLDPNSDVNLKMAHALAANPKDPAYLHRYRNLDPVAQRAIAEKADEIAHDKTLTANTAGLGPGGIPAVMDKQGNQEPIKMPSQVLAEMIHGPEGAKELERSKGFGAEAERMALSSLDPGNVLLMLGGGTLASKGLWAARGVTAAFTAALGKSAYDKMQQDDPGGAAADLFLGGLAVGGHAIAEKAFAKGPKGPPPPRPTTVKVENPSGLGPGPRPTPEPPRTPPQEPPRTRPETASERATRETHEQHAEYQRQYREEQARAQARAQTGTQPPPQEPPRTYRTNARTQEEARARERANQRTQSPPQEPPRARTFYEEQDYRNQQRREAHARTEEGQRQQAEEERTRQRQAENSRRYQERQRQQRAYYEEQARQHRERSAQEGQRPAGDTEAESERRAREAHQEARDRANRAQEQYRRQREQDQERRQQRQQGSSTQPPPAHEPEQPFTPKDPGTPHPEVDKFNTHAPKVDARIQDADVIASAKKRIAELNAKRKMTQAEKIEFGKLNQQVDLHMRGLNDFAERYKAATGKDPNIKVGTWSDATKPTGRAEVLDQIRQALREGRTTFERIFPEAEAPETPKAQTTGKRSSKKAGMLDLGPGAPDSPQERFNRWIKEHPEDIGGAIRAAAGEGAAQNVSRETFSDWVKQQPKGQVYTKAADLFKLWKADYPGTTREQFGQMFQELAASPDHEVVTPSANLKQSDVFTFKDSTGIDRRIAGVRPAKPSRFSVFNELEAQDATGLDVRGADNTEGRQADVSNTGSSGRKQAKSREEQVRDALDYYFTRGTVETARKAGLNVVRNYSELPPVAPGFVRLYHGTRSDNFGEVAKTGIKPGGGRVTGAEQGALFTTTPQSAAAGERYGDGVVVADVPASVVKGKGGRIVQIPGGVPASSIRGLFVDTGVPSEGVSPEMLGLKQGDWANIGSRIDAIVKEHQDAVPESGAAGILQRQSGEAGSTGSERGRVEPGEQGQEVANAEGQAVSQNVDEGRSEPDAPKARVARRSSKQAGFIDLGPLPPKAGSGPVGRVLHHGPEVTNAMNRFDATQVSAQVRGHFLAERLYEGLDPVQKDALDEWLLGTRFEHEANRQTDPAKAAAIRAHPQYMSPADLANLQSFPGVQAAIDRYKDEIKPIIDEFSGKAGVSAAAIAGQSPHYIRLVPTDILEQSVGSGASPTRPRGSWESRARPKSTGARKAAKLGAREYSTDTGAIIRHVLRDVEPKAALNDLWRTLDTQGLIKVQPSGTAGRGWRPPEGYVGDEIQGKFSSMPADLMAKYGSRGKVYLPQDIVQSMDEVTAPKMFSGSKGLEISKRISRALVSTTLGLNVPAVPWHIYRQTGLLRASTALADAKRNPATILASSIPIVGTLAKGAAIASRNADDPIYREIIQYLVEINAISPRSMEGLTGNMGRLPIVERYQTMMHDAMFGMPHGRGVNGWAIRVAVEAYLARARFEQSKSPERDRDYIAHFGAYMRRLSPFLDILADHNPFIRTHGPRIATSLKLALGDTGLKTTRRTGESETTFRMRQAMDRIGAFAMYAAPVVVGLVVLNKVLSGKYPWENGKGHELDINLGNGHYVPIHRAIPELSAPMETAGMASRMHRERSAPAMSMSSGTSAGKMSMGSSSSPVKDAAEDALIGAGNLALGTIDNPALQDVFGAFNKRPYIQHDNRSKGPELMPLSPSKATDAQRAVNYLATVTGLSSLIPTLGYEHDGPFDIGASVIDYLTQHAVKKDYPRGKGMKTQKAGRR